MPLRIGPRFKMKPLFFTLPESFDPGEFLTTPPLRHRGDDARYFVNLIQTKLARGDDEDGWVYLRSGYLKNIMHQPTYAKVRNELREGGATERSCYQVGRHPFGYRLADRFAGDRHVRVPVTDERLIGQWESFIAGVRAIKRPFGSRFIMFSPNSNGDSKSTEIRQGTGCRRIPKSIRSIRRAFWFVTLRTASTG